MDQPEPDPMRLRLDRLKKQRHEAEKLNQKSVREELAGHGLQRQHSSTEWRLFKAQKLKAKIQAEEQGADLPRIKRALYTEQEVSDWSLRQLEKKELSDKGCTDFNQMTSLKYQRLLSASQPGSSAGDSAIEAIARLEKTDKRKRKKNASNEGEDEDDEVTYINDRNKRFNAKVDRHYGRFTREIKENFERGTAV